MSTEEKINDESREYADSLLELAEIAWGIIANAGGGNWETQTPEWRAAAAMWRDDYFAILAAK